MTRKYFWTRRERIAHIIKREEIGESSSGNECTDYTAYCGEEETSWTMAGIPMASFGTIEDVDKNGVRICENCLNILKENS